LIAAALIAWAERHPAIDPRSPPATTSFDGALIEKGKALVALGVCAVCHTRPGGEALAGGRKLPTPFGAIYSTNITPDPETGIGRWSEQAFVRALREGVDRNGGYLYPAFPYDHFTKVTDDDIKSIYAYLMTRTPLAATAPANDLIFPLNNRVLMAGWNFLFLDQGVFAPDPSKDVTWNRGAYLVEGLGHCGGCHTPRNRFGAERSSQRYAGGEVEGWHAPALNSASPAPLQWTADALVNYFLDGWDKDHGIAAGPMIEVVNELAGLTEGDAYAIATYILSFQDQSGSEEGADAAIAFAAEREFDGGAAPVGGQQINGTDTSFGRGNELFAKVCANCHHVGGQTVPLALTSTVNASDPRNLIHVFDEGIQPTKGASDHSMPAFGGSLNNEDLANLVAFVRYHFSKQPAWSDVPVQIGKIRAGKE
jgi:mono/diheme cytochrome c family protein